MLDLADNMTSEQERTDLDMNDSTLTSLLIPPFESKTFSKRSRSRSNQNLASNGGFSQSFYNASHVTCSGSLPFSNSPLNYAPSTINSMMFVSSASSCSSKPTLIMQLSQASSSDSPSPVERDCLLPTTSSSSKSDVSSRNNTTSVPSKRSEFKSLDLHANKVIGTDSTRPEHYGTNKTGNVGTHVQKSPRPVSNAPHYLGSTPQHVNLSIRKQPHHSLSNPEFPLTTTCISVNQLPDRTYSYDNLYAPRKKPPFHPPTKVSPSREKINNLSSHICSSLDQNLAVTLSTYASGSYNHLLEDNSLSSGSSPVCEVMQKIINITTPLLKFNQDHIRTLMELSTVGSSQSVHQDYMLVGTSPSSLNTCGSSFADVELVHDSPMQYLRTLGYKLIDKPLSVLFGIPLEGYMTLTFKLLGEDLQIKDALLKVSV